jgi:hypothetical protein
MDQSKEKPVGRKESGTVEPFSREDQGIEDTGNENDLANQRIQVHKPKKQAAMVDDLEKTPGADRSNPRYPCAVCSNYIAESGECKQGLDVENVQAAQSCSWLNSNFNTFLTNGSNEGSSNNKDEETYKNDVSQLPNSGGQGNIRASSLNLKNIWKK